jgi:hypothetical protein
MPEWRYRGRVVTAEDIVQIRQLIAENPRASRRRLSTLLCEAWQWKQANGALREMVCRGLLLMLHRAGEIELPPIRFRTLNPFVSQCAWRDLYKLPIAPQRWRVEVKRKPFKINLTVAAHSSDSTFLRRYFREISRFSLLVSSTS